FHLAATHLLAPQGRFLLHAAGLLSSAGVWLAFGDSGAGKSTLALAALENRDRILGDDITAVRLTSTGPEAGGIGMPAAVPGDVGGAVAAAGRPMHDPRGRRVLEGDSLTRGWFPVAGSMIVAHGTTPAGAVSRAAETEALHAIMRSFNGVGRPSFLRSFFPCAGALARLPSWRFHHGSEPHTRLAAARRLLGRCEA
ncbi:MAG: hypothetical protein ABR564_00395, partial [Candidatus Dormibacteria bacterium]